MKSFVYSFFSSLLLAVLLTTKAFSQDVTLTTSPIAVSNISQGTTFNPVYIVKMDVATLAATVNSLQFTLTGTHDANDLTTITTWFNASAPTVAGASALENLSGLFAAPHTYTSTFSRTIAAGASGYFIITVTTAAAATNGNTVKANGAANPALFGFTTSPTIINNQTDAAGTQTIQAAGITLTTTAIAAANIAQGTTFNPIYILKMDVTTLAATVNSLQFTITGTHDANDLTTITTWFNASAPTVAGASALENLSGLFTAPHTYTSTFSRTIAAGASGYFIITVTTAAAATNGNTVKIDGTANPAVAGFTTAPTITNNQTDAAGTQTIQAAGIALSTTAIAAANIAQGTTFNPVYIAKMDVTTLGVSVNNIQFTLAGTHDANDLTTITVWFNASAPTVAGASALVNLSGLFAAPHNYTTAITRNIAAGTSGYFIITVTTAAAATNGNTVKLDGIVNPVIFGFTTSPTITNNQTDAAGTQTIQAAGVTLTTSPVAAANIAQAATFKPVYIVKTDVTTSAVTVNNLQFTLTGTHDADDLTTVTVWFNASSPTVAGASGVVNLSGLFAAPHTYNTGSIITNIAAGASGYFIITVTTAAGATNGNTIKLDGAINPVVFSFTTSPPVTNNQTDAAGIQTITAAALPLSLLSFTGNVKNKQEVKLQWLTTGEFNTKGFEIEWSDDGLLFSKIATQSAAGNSTQSLQYNYLHKLPIDGNNYYRLKMTDIDGRFTYSPVIKIQIAISATKIAVFPNPVMDFLQLQVQAVKNETILLQLYSADGKIITSKYFSVTKGNNRLSWNLQQLSFGNYYISSGNNNLETIKIIKN